MAVELKDLYEEIRPQYEVKLHTRSCFKKTIEWVHIVEEPNLARLLHGNELIFNSGLHYRSAQWLRDFIDALDRVHAGGFVMALKDGRTYPQEIIDYCNQIRFPLFSTSWQAPFIDIMRIFSEILLQNEHRNINLTAALKNAIYYPQNEELYLNHFESNGFFRDMTYMVAIASCHAYDTDSGNEKLDQMEKALRSIFKNGIVYEEKGRLLVLVAGHQKARVENEFRKLCAKEPNLYVGIGQAVERVEDICNSYEKAYTAYRLTKTAIPKNMLSYEDLGVYKILADVKEPQVYQAFVREVLGSLLDYDGKNGTDFMRILEAYFEHECSILHTAEALYCHKNTLAYKMNKIKEILGFDILSNENRTRIMLAFYIMKLETG